MRTGNLPGIRRLPVYLNILRRMRSHGGKTVTAVAVAREAGQVVSVVKKDLEMTGATGKTGVGFDLEEIIADIEAFLGWDNPNDAFLVGAGSLGSALINHDRLRLNGLNIVAAFDTDPNKIGWRIHDIEVLPLTKLSSLAARMHVTLGIITVPSAQAQGVADLLVSSGITRIWSFAEDILSVPDGVVVQREDLSAGLAELLVKSNAANEKGQK